MPWPISPSGNIADLYTQVTVSGNLRTMLSQWRDTMGKFVMVAVISAAASIALGPLSAHANGNNMPTVSTWRGDPDAWKKAAEAERRRGHVERAETAEHIHRQIEGQAAYGAMMFHPVGHMIRFHPYH